MAGSEIGAGGAGVSGGEPARLPARRAWPSDPHATVLAEVSGGCVVRGVDAAAVYLQGDGLYRVPLDGGAPALLHSDPSATLSYRVAHGRVVLVQTREQSLGTISLLEPDGTTTLLDDGARPSSWVVGPSGVYFGDVTHTEPALFLLPFAPTRQPVETLRPVGNEDRIEALMAQGGELYFVAEHIQMDGGRGHRCHELRGGPAGRSRTLRRASPCPSDTEILHVPALSPRAVYYWRDRAFRRIPRRGGREELVIEAPGLPQAAFSDDRVLLWLDGRGLLRLRLDPGARPEVIGERAWVLAGIDVADGQIYWTRREPSEPCRLMRRALDAPALAPAPDR